MNDKNELPERLQHEDYDFSLQAIDAGSVDNAALARAIRRVKEQRGQTIPHTAHNTKHSSHSSHSKGSW